MGMLKVLVQRRRMVAINVCCFELVALDGEDLPKASAGAHIDVHLPGGIIRQYSLCNNQSDHGVYRIAVLRDKNSRGGSEAMHENIGEGQILEISEPRNQFPLIQNGYAILIAGGIGITPLFSMAWDLFSKGSPFEVHYCGSTPDHMAFFDELMRSPFSDAVSIYCSQTEYPNRFDARRVLAVPTAEKHVYVCGPDRLINHVIETAKDYAWMDGHVHQEHFGPVFIDPLSERSFEIFLDRSKVCLSVPPDKTALEVLVDHGVGVPYSCQTGVCGTCIVRLLGGEADHRDLFLTEAEHVAGEHFLPCCSRAKSSRLVLDL